MRAAYGITKAVAVFLVTWGAGLEGSANAAGVGISGTGITFPDASYQNTAPYPPLPAKMVWVAKADGDYTSPVQAIDDLANWCGTPSATNPCVIKIAPGVFELGANRLVVPDWVSVEGSGRKATFITGLGVDLPATFPCVVTMTSSSADDSSTLGRLTIAVLGNDYDYGCALRTEASGPRRIDQASLLATGAAENIGFSENSLSTTLTNLNAEASGGTKAVGIESSRLGPSSVFEMHNVTASASGAIDDNYGIHIEDTHVVMTDVTATATGGTQSIGIFNENSADAVMTNVAATASDGSTNRAIYNSFTSYATTNNPVLRQVIAQASGSEATNHGIYNGNAVPFLHNVIAIGEGGTNNYGVSNNNSTPRIQGSHLRGSTAGLVISAIPSGGGLVTDTFVSDTKIEGGVDDSSAPDNCRNTYDALLVDVSC